MRRRGDERMKRGGVVFSLAMAAGLVGCAAPKAATREPANLYALKLEVRAYVDAGTYLRDIENVAGRANAWLHERAAQRRAGERLAVVFDLDETLLFNWPHLERNDFGYMPDVWQRWIDEAKAPAIEPTRAVYRFARQLGIEVIYITGRRERDRAATEQNLRAIDCAQHALLVCKPQDSTATAAVFKTAARERLTKEGWTIVANLGDQESDLVGGFAERTFKLPNPFYLTE